MNINNIIVIYIDISFSIVMEMIRFSYANFFNLPHIFNRYIHEKSLLCTKEGNCNVR